MTKLSRFFGGYLPRKQFGRASLALAVIVGLAGLGTLTWQELARGAAKDAKAQVRKLSSRDMEKLETLRDHRLVQVRDLNIDLSKFPFGPFRIVVDPRITFNDTVRTLCYYRNNFFEKDVRASYELIPGSMPVDLLAGSIEPPLVGKFGHYYVQPEQAGDHVLHVLCDGFAYDVPVSVPNPVSGFRLPDIRLANAPPVIASFEAKVAGSTVVGAAPGSTVMLDATVSDANGDHLTFTWGSNSGTITATGGNTAQWQLPNSSGLNFAYVLVSDGKGGYTERNVIVSTDAGVVAGTQAVPAPGAADKLPLVDHFLTFFSTKSRHVYLPHGSPGADSKMGSCRYYVAIGAVEGCDDHGNMINPKVTFASWKQKWGFDVSSAEVSAIYANKTDLNLQRAMHGITSRQGTAFYVCNYPRADNANIGTDLSNAINNTKLVACVAMEYSGAKFGLGRKAFTKFLTFAPSGKLLQSVNLDGRGEKYMPGACVVCHGAKHDFTRVAENGTTPANLGAQFLPFDLNNMAFGSGSFSQANLDASLRSLNKLVLDTNPSPAIVDVVNGWYPTPSSSFTSGFVPSGWVGHEKLYNDVVKPYCRTCHVAMVPDDPTVGLSFRSFSEFNQFNFELNARVCGNDVGVERKRYSMPNSLVTFNRFWDDASASATLLQHLVAENEIPANGLCNRP